MGNHLNQKLMILVNSAEENVNWDFKLNHQTRCPCTVHASLEMVDVYGEVI